MIEALKAARAHIDHRRTELYAPGTRRSNEDDAILRVIDAALASRPPSEPAPPRFDTPEGFLDWFAKNYNGEVVFSDPAWHARIIFRTAVWHYRAAQEAHPALRRYLEDTLAHGTPNEYTVAKAALDLLDKREAGEAHPAPAEWNETYWQRREAGEAQTAAAQEPAGTVKLPTNRAEAELMVKAGMMWLEQQEKP